MTVLKNKRGQGKLEVLLKARSLAKYTLVIAKNEKIFPKRNRWLLTQPIVKTTLEIFTDIRKANSINVKTDDDYKMRRAYQLDAYAKCEALLSLIELAYVTLHVEGKRVEFWTGCVVKVEELLQAWTYSDYQRYVK